MTKTAAQQQPKQEMIRQLEAAGFALVPLCSLTISHNHFGRPCRTPGKVPKPKGWETTQPGQYKEEALAKGNYGIVLPDTVVVVDVDPRNFKTGDKPLARLAEKIGGFPETFVSRTGGGGLHVVLNKPAAVAIRLRHPDFPGIEFKTRGGHIVGPGCDHVSGKQYSVVKGAPAALADAPTALLQLIERPKYDFPEVGTGKYQDDGETRSRYLAYLLDVAQPSVQGQGGNANAYKVACHARDLGLSPDVAHLMMLDHWNDRCAPPWDAVELREVVAHAYAYAQGGVGGERPELDFGVIDLSEAEKTIVKDWEVGGQSGRLIKNFRNLLRFFKHQPSGLRKVFAQNEFTGRVEFVNPAPWHYGKLPLFHGVSDTDLKLLKAHLANKHDFESSVNTLEEAVTIAAHDDRFHPVREYLNSLVWDGAPRLDTWITDYLRADDSIYVRACARKVLCAAVMRVMRPGVKFDHVLVLEGKQGIGKSSVCRILAGEWGTDAPLDPHSRDTVQLMQGRWIVELAELEVSKRADLQALRAFISRTKDEARLAYGRTVGEFPRQSIFIGSINPGADGTYLKDDTGNRRWWPVKCGESFFDLKGLREARNQLFAEAVHVLKTKEEPLHMHTVELRDAAKAEADKRHAEHPWTERIATWLQETQLRPETRSEFITTRDVFIGAIGGADKQLDSWNAGSIGTVMKALGYDHVRRMVRGHNRAGWVMRPITLLSSKAAMLELLGDLA